MFPKQEAQYLCVEGVLPISSKPSNNSQQDYKKVSSLSLKKFTKIDKQLYYADVEIKAQKS